MKPYFFAIGLGLCLALFTVAGCTSALDPRGFSNGFVYELSIRSSGPLTNTTFFLPLPVINNKPVAGNMSLGENLFSKPNFSVQFIRSPPGLNLSNSSFGNNEAWFIKIMSNKIVPDPVNNSAFEIFLVENVPLKSPTPFVNTLRPLEENSVFLPKVHFSPSQPVIKESQSPDRIEYVPVRDDEEIPVFVDYLAEPDTHVEIYSKLSQDNSWKEDYDSWISNYYQDSFDWTGTGDQHGWKLAQGILTSANGVYPNLSSPVWQAVIQANTTEG
ncbi:MAG TPA: hypothetical protein VEI81_01985 [Methanoregula sp.]|nr:hypothetical protein [Methanoregula sp.]